MKEGKYRHAIFAVVYSIVNSKIEYAILKRKKHWVGWEFTKGKIERFETKRMAARREVKEETGLDILKMKRFHVDGEYLYKKILEDRPGIIGQTYHLFAVQVKKGKIKVDKKEHSFGKWMIFKEAMKKLKWANQKKCLKIVNNWLINEIQGI
jgi:8-oxo-dGTP pyrophosphatase MutT (NUDIX family)